MSLRAMWLSSLCVVVGLVSLHGASVSRQQAEALDRKIDSIAEHGSIERPAARRTPVSEGEANSWLTYRAEPFLPEGVAQPAVTLVGNGRVVGRATVDLDAVGKSRTNGGVFDPWRLLGGRLPVTVTGVVHTAGGRGRFELQQADISGVPVPKTIIQELVSYYSRTADHPQGARLDDEFDLPAAIQRIEIGAGQAVVVQ